MSERNSASEPPTDAVGMIAGGGMFPVCFARGARKHGVRVVAAAIKGEASDELEDEVDEIHWTGLARLGSWIRIFKRAGVSSVVMCGNITKTRMYDGWGGWSLLPDIRTAKLWFRKLRSHEDHTVLEAVANEFESEGITVESSVLYCPELLVREGCLTRREPDDDQWADIRFGWPMAKQIAAMQIGQSIVVKDGTVVAVEGIDGTDATLRRGGELCDGDAVAIKVAKEGHDERFDIPCVGPGTVESMVDGGVSVLAMEADKTLLLEREKTIEKADREGIVLVAVDMSSEPDEG